MVPVSLASGNEICCTPPSHSTVASTFFFRQQGTGKRPSLLYGNDMRISVLLENHT